MADRTRASASICLTTWRTRRPSDHRQQAEHHCRLGRGTEGIRDRCLSGARKHRACLDEEQQHAIAKRTQDQGGPDDVERASAAGADIADGPHGAGGEQAGELRGGAVEPAGEPRQRQHPDQHQADEHSPCHMIVVRPEPGWRARSRSGRPTAPARPRAASRQTEDAQSSGNRWQPAGGAISRRPDLRATSCLACCPSRQRLRRPAVHPTAAPDPKGELAGRKDESISEYRGRGILLARTRLVTRAEVLFFARRVC